MGLDYMASTTLSGFLAIAGLAATYKSGLLMILVLKKDDNFLDVVWEYFACEKLENTGKIKFCVFWDWKLVVLFSMGIHDKMRSWTAKYRNLLFSPVYSLLKSNICSSI